MIAPTPQRRKKQLTPSSETNEDEIIDTVSYRLMLSIAGPESMSRAFGTHPFGRSALFEKSRNEVLVEKL
jgi:hypothetical protein